MERFAPSTVTEAGALLPYVKPAKLSAGDGVGELVRYDVVDSGRSGGEFFIIAYIDSADFSGAYIRQLGLYVENPDGGADVLYAVSLWEGDYPPLMSASGALKSFRVTMKARIGAGVLWRGNAGRADLDIYTPLTMFQPLFKNELWYGEHRHDKTGVDGLEDAGWSVGDIRFLSYRMPEYPRGDYLPCDGRLIDLNDYPELREKWDYVG